MGNNVTFDEMNELLDEIYRSGGETWVEIDGQTYYTDWGYGVVAIEFFIRMLENRKSDNDATPVRHSVAEDADEIIEHIINANMMSMPYDVYSELFDAVDGLGVEIKNLQSENAKLRELVRNLYKRFHGVVLENWSYSTEDFDMLACRMRELGVEVD